MKSCDLNPWGLAHCPMCDGFQNDKQKKDNANASLEEFLMLDLMIPKPSQARASEK